MKKKWALAALTVFLVLFASCGKKNEKAVDGKVETKEEKKTASQISGVWYRSQKPNEEGYTKYEILKNGKIIRSSLFGYEELNWELLTKEQIKILTEENVEEVIFILDENEYRQGVLNYTEGKIWSGLKYGGTRVPYVREKPEYLQVKTAVKAGDAKYAGIYTTQLPEEEGSRKNEMYSVIELQKDGTAILRMETMGVFIQWSIVKKDGKNILRLTNSEGIASDEIEFKDDKTLVIGGYGRSGQYETYEFKKK